MIAEQLKDPKEIKTMSDMSEDEYNQKQKEIIDLIGFDHGSVYERKKVSE